MNNLGVWEMDGSVVWMRLWSADFDRLRTKVQIYKYYEDCWSVLTQTSAFTPVQGESNMAWKGYKYIVIYP